MTAMPVRRGDGSSGGAPPPTRRALWSDLPSSPLFAPAFALMDGALGALAGGGGGPGPLQDWNERLRAFELFQRAPSLVRGGATMVRDPLPAIQDALAMGPWERLWVLEGLGFAAVRQGGAARLLRSPDVPASAQIPLHTGCGLGLAADAVEGVMAGGVGRAIETFANRCRQLSQPGGRGAMLEALGLAARTLRPESLAELAHAAGEVEGGFLRPYFWHGVGRALFFVPSQWLSLGMDNPLRAALREPPDEATRAEAVAGVAWATTLVGLRTPAAVDRFLSSCDAEVPVHAVQHGIASALLLWAHANGVDAGLERFLGYAAPQPARWHEWVVEPAERALATRLPHVADGQFGELFRVEGVAPS